MLFGSNLIYINIYMFFGTVPAKSLELLIFILVQQVYLL